MNFGIVDLIPYSVIVGVFILCRLLQYRHTRKIMNKFTEQAEKSRILKELLETECEYIALKEKQALKMYPRIQDSLKEVSMLLDRVGCNLNLNNIEIVQIKGDKERAQVRELIAEREKAPKDIQELLDKKIRLVNEMASIKYPFMYVFTKFSTRLQRKAMLIGLIVLLNLLILIMNLKEKGNFTKDNRNGTKKSKIEDQYIAMQFN